MEHIIFDVKLESGFTYKARFIEDSHKLDIPPLMEYESVISRDSVWKVLNMQDLGRNLQKNVTTC